ncbi:MAG: hypothetical protein V7L29_16665 [Nostoc sp.]|uniref:hypothetical protein n=1 Tax=Nostoc sp. TaxID=1180 RepID=UPI002FF50ACF
MLRSSDVGNRAPDAIARRYRFLVEKTATPSQQKRLQTSLHSIKLNNLFLGNLQGTEVFQLRATSVGVLCFLAFL